MLYMLTNTVHRCLIIIFGVLYPAFNSYKALNRRDGYEQVKWMMYWIVFAAFTSIEVLTDIFLCWLPLYYEVKIIFVLWLVLPITRGSSYLYRKIIHPNLKKHENEIERYISSASTKGCEVLFEFGQHSMNFAASAVLKTADHLKRSYSVGDVSKNEPGQSAFGNSTSHRVLKPLPSGNKSQRTGTVVTRKPSHSPSGATTYLNLHQASDPKQNFHDLLAGQASQRAKKALYKVDEER